MIPKFFSFITALTIDAMPTTLELAQTLIRQPSVTPDDAGCQDLLTEALTPYGFSAEPMNFGKVHNLWLRRGTAAPLFVFAGHTDVVPTGPQDQWLHPPFAGHISDGMLHGRGAADMKGSLAAMVTACQQFTETHPDHAGSIALLLTSDEEGPAVDGTTRVIETLQARAETIDWCVVGEPTSCSQLGDAVRIGRRGSLSGTLCVRGIQGHVAYPHLADNPIHCLAAIISALAAYQWDQGNQHFPPTSFQVSNVAGGTGADNVIPGTATANFNLRYCPVSTVETIHATVNDICRQHCENFEIDWQPASLPYQSARGALLAATTSAIQAETGLEVKLSTDGGTSDGRFIAPTGAEVVEFGPVNRTIHQVDEQVASAELDTLAVVYQRILADLLT